MTLSEYAGVENMTPRTTARLKLIKLVRLSFATYSRPPKTTSDFYRVGKILGKGAFGKVNLAIHKLSQKMVALKSINKNYLSEEKQMKKKIMHEVNIIKVLRHKHIVKWVVSLILGSFKTSKPTSISCSSWNSALAETSSTMSGNAEDSKKIMGSLSSNRWAELIL